MHLTDSEDGRATKALVVINVAIFFLTEYLLSPTGRGVVMALFGLSAGQLAGGWFWQLLTYQFLHGSPMHLFLNMVGLWFAGREFERAIGTRMFLTVYFVSGIVGGLAQVALSGSTSLLIGASGSVFGVMVGLTAMYPNLPITALLFFILPVRMRAKTLGFLLVGSSLAMWLLGFEPGIGHLAHLGGALTGFLFGRGLALYGNERTRSFIDPRVFRTRSSEKPAEFTVIPTKPANRTRTEDVLEKLLRSGINALTREEHRILEVSRQNRARRWR